MAEPTRLLVVDLGAESGRVMRGELGDDGLRISEVSRFPTPTTRLRSRLRWEMPRILASLEKGLRQSAGLGPVAGVGVDTWGVDFGLLDAEERLVDLPVSYRDSRTEGVMEGFLQRLSPWAVYERTGIQFLPFNTLFQLAAMAGSGDPELQRARHLLLMPDLVHHHLTGERCTERTNATTTQCFDPVRRSWRGDLLEVAGVEPGLMQRVVEPGSILAPLRRPLAEATGLGPIPVILPCTHDTASAVAAVPAEEEDWAYISSGTWSLMGVETPAPVINRRAMASNFTNEGGVGATNRLLKNITGLWLVQCIRDEMAPGTDYGEITAVASSAPPMVSLVDPDDRSFLRPGSMVRAMEVFCTRTGQPVPATTGAFIRCALESLAFRYRSVLEEIREVAGRRPAVIHVVGGGSRNRLLNQMTADATGLPVVAGPVEATAAGNLLVQAVALGLVKDYREGRMLVRRSFTPERFEPRDPGPWDDAWERFSTLRSEP